MPTPPRAPIRVLIVDGDPRVGRALGRLLQDAGDVTVVGTASEAGAVLALAGRLQPAVAVVDVRTARLDGLAVTRSLRAALPELQVVAVSVYGLWRDEALAAGACQFLLKDASRAALRTAIRLAAHGQCQVPAPAPGGAESVPPVPAVQRA